MSTFKRGEILLPILLVVVALIACSSSSGGSAEITEADKEAAINVVKWNLYYLESEDLNGAMNTLHEDFPWRDENQAEMMKAFSTFDLGYELLETELVSIDEETAKVRVKQLTWKKAGEQPFQTNRITAVHTLKKSADGNWRIFGTEIEDVEY